MRAYDKPGNPNPYVAALAILGLLGLALGVLITLTAEAAPWPELGSVILSIGGLMTVGWLVTEALLWRVPDREQV